MMTLISKIDDAINPLRALADKIGKPLLLLGMRLYMANIFFKSGKLKLDNYLNGNPEATVFLFEDIHPIPGVPAELAAAAGTAAEVILPVLLALGLFGRFGAIGLFFMTVTIQYIVPSEYELANVQHYFWMFLLATVTIIGPGKISLDYALRKWVLGRV